MHSSMLLAVVLNACFLAKDWQTRSKLEAMSIILLISSTFLCEQIFMKMIY